jgi:maltose alpha-D-glucosyltransferase/alpha-amylase
VVRLVGDRAPDRYTIALTGWPLREARPGDGAWAALGRLMAAGRVVGAVPRRAGWTPEAALVARPGAAMPAGGPGTERDPGTDQSNTIVVLGVGPEAVMLKAYRRLEPGLNPDLEMTAFLTEQARFPAVPPLAGYAELVPARGEPTTLAMAQAWVADAADAFESLAEALVAWQLAPGEVSEEVSTEIAVDLGALTAALHAAVADDHGLLEMGPRDATRAEVRSWAASARARLDRAGSLLTGENAALLRELGPGIAEALTTLDAEPGVPQLIRAHGDFHLGQVLVAPDGLHIVDFEGEAMTSTEVRRAHRHPLRDVASMLRSLDHVGRSAMRRVRERAPGLARNHRGLDVDVWIARARERFLAAYTDGLRDAGVPSDLDPALLRAFEVDKELYELAYAAAYFPSWLYAPLAGIRALFDPRTSFEPRR